jgi:nucleolin
MDFKSILSKLDSMEAPASTPAAPTIAKAVQLNEDAQLRVLAGQTTYVAEAKKKKDEEVKEEMKVGDKKPSSTGGTIEKTATGVKHTAGKNYGGSKAETDSDDEDDKPAKKKAKKESIEPEFKSKFMKMVEAKKEEADKKKADAKKKKMEEGAKPDFLDMDKDGDKKEPFKKAVADKKKAGPKKVDEVSDATKASYVKKASADVGKMATGEKDGSKMLKRMKGIEKAQESKMMPKGKKRPVKESVEQKLTFREMMTLVVESGGQQQIDAVDQELFAWAQRVAKQKLGEGMKAEVYAGMVYERMGGVFEMYDVLAEDQN